MSQYPEGSDLGGHSEWGGVEGGNAFMLNGDGLSIHGSKNNEWSLLQHQDAMPSRTIGDAITVSIDFTFEQVKAKYDSELIRVGAGDGENRLLATFNRKGWGDFNAIGMDGYQVGAVFPTSEIGFKKNTSLGMSDSLRMAMTLTRAEADQWNMVVILTNLKSGDLVKRWEKKELSFPHGAPDALFGMIQVGASDAVSGVKDRKITRFEVSDQPALAAPPQTWTDSNFRKYILPMTRQQGPIYDKVFGVDELTGRDPNNGLEDQTLQNWCYWDGSIVKDDAGKYHMYASRWDQAQAHGTGWKDHSKGIHAVSDNVMGPYIDQGMTWPDWNDGLGHNVIGLRMFDGRYAMVTSDRTPGDVFVSDGPSGPFKFHGEIKWEANGFNPGLAAYEGGKGYMSNVMIIPRHDGRYMIVPRSTCIMISDDGILGPYKIVSDRVYKDMPEIPQARMEDPTAWYSGGMYHMLVNHWPGKTTYHFSSLDGIKDWKYRGIAYRKDEALFRYEDGTVDEWAIVQRPTAYTEDGHITHFNFSVIDITKGGDRGNDNHGSKIIVVPFDGESFDLRMQAIVREEQGN
ncbi:MULTISPECIES: glycoside hydrolase family protein [unclassified Lentimonas]|uniref:glycoside hydrolase family protein n=1 Tax=unclassified Lentimonas TaxID=2630993 RepID=UPI001389767F|nr:MULTISPECIES: glycoside hydrolase family protein [unclassified Lentimonas]